jgi:hypothetical protein
MRRSVGRFRQIAVALVTLATLAVGGTALAAWTDPVPASSPVPGGVAVIDVGAPEDPRPELVFGGKRVLVVPRRQGWIALVGLPATLPPGRYILTGHGASVSLAGIEFTIHPRRFPVRVLEPVSPAVGNDPDPALLVQRRRAEAQELRGLVATWTDQEDVDLQFRPPLEGSVHAPFGVRRVLDDELLAPTDSVEFDVEHGTAVHAPASGTVLHTADYLHRGRTVVIDHGQGLISVLAHLDAIEVSPEQRIDAGTRIGSAGSTGQTERPTLRWTVVLNGVPIDPDAMLVHE